MFHLVQTANQIFLGYFDIIEHDEGRVVRLRSEWEQVILDVQ